MKYNQFSAFEKHLKSSAPNHFANLYLIVAQDDFERKLASDNLLQYILEKENDPRYSVRTLDAETLTLQLISNEMDSFHLFSKKNIVFIQQIDKLKTQVKEYLEKHLGTLGKTTLILSGATINQATNFYKKIEKNGVILSLPKDTKPWEKEKICFEWIGQEIAKVSKTMDKQATMALLQQVGTDYASIKQELDKLTCYVGAKEQITIKDVAAICTHIDHQTIWQLGEAILQKSAKEALSIGHSLLKNNTSIFALLRGLRSQFQTELQIATLLENGGGEQEVTMRFPYVKGAIFQKHLKYIQCYGKSSLAQSIISIDSAEVQAKNSNIQEEILLERLIFHLANCKALLVF